MQHERYKIVPAEKQKNVAIGGGQSSCEAAYLMVLQGKHPIIVEYANDLITAQATCLAKTSFLRDALSYHQVPVYLNSSLRRSGTAMQRSGAMTAACGCTFLFAPHLNHSGAKKELGLDYRDKMG